MAQVPDVGSYVRWFHSQKVLTGAAVALCAQKDATSYRTDGDLPASCTGLKYMTDFSGHLITPDLKYGPLLPLTSALYLEADGQTCTEAGSPSPCNYYLNISPSAGDRELHAAAGTDDGAEDAKADGGDSVGTQVLKAIAKAAAEDAQKQARRQAQVASAAPSGGFVRFKDGCNAFYNDPANARLSMSDATGWCACLSEQYRNLMTPKKKQNMPMTSSGSSMEESHSRGATERPSPTQRGLAYIQPSIDANVSRPVEPYALPTRESGFTNQTDPGGQSWRISEPHL
jgi:hypothetical protein